MTDDTKPPYRVETIEILLDVVVESWRFGRLFKGMLAKMDAGDQGKYKSQFRWYQKRLEDSLTEIGMQIVNVEGHVFDPGMAARPLNIDEFKPDDTLVVDQMLEPIVVGPDGIVRAGTITLMRMES